MKFELENQLSTYRIFNYFALHAMFSYKQNINKTEFFNFEIPRLGFPFCHPLALKLSSVVFSSRISLFPHRLTKKSDYCSPKKHRSSRPELFYKKSVLKKFAKYTGKHVHQSLFLKTLQIGSLHFY